MNIALVTVYYPNEDVEKNVKQLLLQFDKVFICDNTPTYVSKIDFTNISDKIEYIYFNKNNGLSIAFNYVLNNKDYIINDDDFIFFFDQDSYIKDCHVDLLIKEYLYLEEGGLDIGALGPCYFNTSSGVVEMPKKKILLNNHSYKVSSLITSSLCCKFANLKQIGFWNESIFLDMADWDLSWRFIKAGKLCVLSDVVIMNHTLGIGEKKIFGFLRLRQGSPIREYYQTRDCLYLLNKKYVPIKYKIRFILMLTVRPIVHIIFLDDKLKRLKYICRGVVDFCKNKKGAFE